MMIFISLWVYLYYTFLLLVTSQILNLLSLSFSTSFFTLIPCPFPLIPCSFLPTHYISPPILFFPLLPLSFFGPRTYRSISLECYSKQIKLKLPKLCTSNAFTHLLLQQVNLIRRIKQIKRIIPLYHVNPVLWQGILVQWQLLLELLVHLRY